MRRRGENHWILAAIGLVAIGLTDVGRAAGAPRIASLHRCGDLLRSDRLEFCVTLREPTTGGARLLLGGASLGGLDPGATEFTVRLDAARHRSAPFWVEDGVGRSNAVWLSMQPSAVLAATSAEVARSDEDILTYVDLVGVIVEEKFDAPAEARRLAEKYGARIVGAIEPLRVYQLRLPVRDLVHRDALVLRLGGEESIDAVVVEESSAEDSDRDDGVARAPDVERAANRFVDAVDYYRRSAPNRRSAPQRLAVIERSLDFDAASFAGLIGAPPGGLRLYGRDADDPERHGSTVAGVLAAAWGEGAARGLLRGMEADVEVIVDRGSDAGVLANVAASVRLVQDGARVLNWSWGLHRVGAHRVGGGDVDSGIRSGVAFEGYEELLEEFFIWLRRAHPDVVVVNSAGNGGSFSGDDDYRLPSSFVTPQLLVVGAHQRSALNVPVEDPRHAERRAASNIDARVDVMAAACVPSVGSGTLHCGTSYATALVSGVVAAMLTINPALRPAEIRELLRRASLPIGGEAGLEPTEAEDLTAPILPSERAERLHHRDVGRGARLDMRRTLELTVESLTRPE